MIKKIKADVIVILIILAAAVAGFLLLYLNKEKGTGILEIVQNGEVAGVYSLKENNTVTVHDEENGYNLILINDGKVIVTDADCPDKLCVKQRAISVSGESIICLPHKMVVQIITEEKSDLDAVTY